MESYKKLLGYKTLDNGETDSCVVWRSPEELDLLSVLFPSGFSEDESWLSSEILSVLGGASVSYDHSPSWGFEDKDILRRHGHHFKETAIIEISSSESSSFWLSAHGTRGLRSALHHAFFAENKVEGSLEWSLAKSVAILDSVTNSAKTHSFGLVKIHTDMYEFHPPFLASIILNGNMNVSDLFKGVDSDNGDVSIRIVPEKQKLEASLGSFISDLKIDETIQALAYVDIKSMPVTNAVKFFDSKQDAQKYVQALKTNGFIMDNLVVTSTSKQDAIYLGGPTGDHLWHVNIELHGLHGFPTAKIAYVNPSSPSRHFISSSYIVPPAKYDTVFCDEVSIDTRRHINVVLHLQQSATL